MSFLESFWSRKTATKINFLRGLTNYILRFPKCTHVTRPQLHTSPAATAPHVSRPKLPPIAANGEEIHEKAKNVPTFWFKVDKTPKIDKDSFKSEHQKTPEKFQTFEIFFDFFCSNNSIFFVHVWS